MTATAAERRAAHRLILEQAATGELVAIENYARMIPLAPTAESKFALLDEAAHERRHIRVLVGLGKMLDLGEINVVVDDPYWNAVRDAVNELVEKRDLEGARFVQDVVLESYAVALYRAVIPHVEAVFRPHLLAIVSDEEKHLADGIDAFCALLQRDHAAALALVDFAHRRVAKPLSEWVRPTDCLPLCGVCARTTGHCGKRALEKIDVDTATLAAEFANVYGDALRRAGLSPAEAIRYVAGLLG